MVDVHSQGNLKCDLCCRSPIVSFFDGTDKGDGLNKDEESCGNGPSTPKTTAIAFLFQPCSHMTCVCCFHEIVSTSCPLRCPSPGCRQWVKSSKLIEIRRSSIPGPQQKLMKTLCDPPQVLETIHEIQEVTAYTPDEQLDPFRFWALHEPPIHSAMVYVCYRSTEGEATFYNSFFNLSDNQVRNQQRQKANIDNDSAEELVKIFARIFHPLLFRSFRQRCNMTESRGQQHHDRILALRCLHALASGRVTSPTDDHFCKLDFSNWSFDEKDQCHPSGTDKDFDRSTSNVAKLVADTLIGAMDTSLMTRSALKNPSSVTIPLSLEDPKSPNTQLKNIGSPAAMSPFLSTSYEEQNCDGTTNTTSSSLQGLACLDTKLDDDIHPTIVTPDTNVSNAMTLRLSPFPLFAPLPSRLSSKDQRTENGEGEKKETNTIDVDDNTPTFPYVLVFMLVSAILMISE
jgi:hypothetical protein